MCRINYHEYSGNNNIPLVSVVMPVYNCELYVVDAITSILNQTFDDFEFIIINDGSTDKTGEMIAKFADMDPRIVQLDQYRQGVTKSLILATQIARGCYIVRQDGDDLSNLSRIDKQIEFLESNQEYSLVGSAVEIISDTEITY